jgi:hypothetical protein
MAAFDEHPLLIYLKCTLCLGHCAVCVIQPAQLLAAPVTFASWDCNCWPHGSCGPVQIATMMCAVDGIVMAGSRWQAATCSWLGAEIVLEAGVVA